MQINYAEKLSESGRFQKAWIGYVRSCVCMSANDVIVIDTNGDGILNDYLIHIQTESQSKSEKNCEMAGHVRYASVHG